MLASLEKKPFSSPDWIFEPKLDGYRTLSFVRNGQVRLISRNAIDVTAKYPLITGGLAGQPADELVLDGEIVALDEKGRACFQCLQDSNSHHRYPVFYYVFDILYLNGYDLSSVPLHLRKRLLDGLLVPSSDIRPVEYLEQDGLALYEAALKNGLEGVIAKRKDSLYIPGKRSRGWLKIKSVLSDEFVIGGYTQGTGNRAKTFGALLLGVLDDSGRLVFAGHVGTGFDERLLLEVKKRLDAIRSDRSPFKVDPAINAPATWVRPVLVAEIKFAERTADGLLRAPVFLRLRYDKSPSEARQAEYSQAVSASPSGQPSGVQFVDRGNRHAETERNMNKGNEQDISPVEGLLLQLHNPRPNFDIEVGQHKIHLSNLDKVLWPSVGEQPALTKRDLLVYLVRVSPYLLPHLQDRPLTLTRFPGGVNGERFYQKHWPGASPDFLKTVTISEHGGAVQDYLVCNNLATLVWLGQMANIDFHTWFSRITPGVAVAGSAGRENPDFFTGYPDFIIFDLDPYIYSGKEAKGAEPELNLPAFRKTCEMALRLREILKSLSLSSFIKTSGQTGLHIYVPIIRQFDFHSVHSASKTISSYLQQKYPDDVTLEWAVEKRSGKIFLDYNQNVRGKTLASVYSPRPTSQATVSTPLSWDEIGKIYPADFTILTVPDRLAKTGDLWASILEKRSDLKDILGMN
jgi:bifunctional non-homologous end joining protein LigD